MPTFKDYTGLNICVRDIFQGPDDCGHDLEADGYPNLNTVGFSTPANGASSFEIKLNTLNVSDQTDIIVKYKDKQNVQHARQFEFITGSIPSELWYVGVSLTDLTVSNDSDKITLARRLADKITYFLPYKYKKTVLPIGSSTASIYFECCSPIASTVTAPKEGGGYIAESSFIAGVSGYYNDLPYCFSPSWHTLNNVNLHRNGPYGFCSFKQIRNTDNRVMKHLRKNNKLTFEIPSRAKKVVTSKGQIDTIFSKQGSLVCYDEPCVVSKHHPLIYNVGKIHSAWPEGGKSLHRFSMKTSYNNEITFFSNNASDKYHNVVPAENDNYEFIKDLYLDGALSKDGSPLNEFEFMKFRQTVYPPEIYTFKSYIRKRKHYSSGFWRTDEADRFAEGEKWLGGVDPSTGILDNGFSVWPMDSNKVTLLTSSNWFLSNSIGTEAIGETLPTNSGSAPGELQLSYGQIGLSLPASLTKTALNNTLSPEPYYSRRHTLIPSASIGATPAYDHRDRSDRDFDFYNYFGPAGAVDLKVQLAAKSYATSSVRSDRFGGETVWQTADQMGRTPFYDSIDDFYEQIGPKYKDYSILPEFRMSDHIDFYDINGVDAQNYDIFDIKGGLTSNSSSAAQEFYKIYSNSDFLCNFDILRRDHADFVDPSVITLTCKAVMKLLPYKGFYPIQRSWDIAQQFRSSFSNFVEGSGSNDNTTAYFDAVNIDFQNIYSPMFAPGVLFNSIKAGVACDYPILTSSLSVMKDPAATGEAYIGNDSFSERVPFEALVSPEKYLANKKIFCMEPHASGNTERAAIWNGSGEHDSYIKMASNFLAEVPSFFLDREQFTTFTSRPQSSPNFGNVVAGNTYAMRVKMYRSMNQASRMVYNYLKEEYSVPQDIQTSSYGFIKETLTMYSRPSAFGPPCYGENTFETGSDGKQLQIFEFGSGSGGTYHFDCSSNQSNLILCLRKDSIHGYNFPFTPPYYHGESWADISFTPTRTGKYSLEEIMNSCSVEYTRFDTGSYKGPEADETTKQYASASYSGPQSFGYINQNAMQLSASVNLFSKGELRRIPKSTGEYGEQKKSISVVVDSVENNKARWVIQTKFETPILNFNTWTKGSKYNAIILPRSGQGGIYSARGMWHQSGAFPAKNEGIYLQITDIPKPYLKATKYLSVSALEKYKSLSDVVGFTNKSKKLGRIAPIKKIHEAVVAVPFLERNNRRNFFKINKRDIRNVLNKADLDFAGVSVRDMVQKMKKYVFPPSMDFVKFKQVEPFAMYIFEFEHSLTKHDLSKIWQGVMPDISVNHKEAQSSISHELLANELLGGGAKLINTDDGIVIDEGAKGTPFNNKIKWMVFKVKQRAQTDYNNKIIERNQTLSFFEEVENHMEEVADSLTNEERDQFNYNWPYDFFSLVELAKVDVEVEFSEIEKDEKTKSRKTKSKKSSKKSLKKDWKKPFRYRDKKEEKDEEDDSFWDSLFHKKE